VLTAVRTESLTAEVPPKIWADVAELATEQALAIRRRSL
jgi:hypothetical protein